MIQDVSRVVFVLTIATAWVLAPGSVVTAQQTRPGADGGASRSDLQEAIEFYQAAAESPAYSGPLRAEARTAAETLRTRLVRGDFEPGDRIYLRVAGFEVLTDTFTVAPDRVLQLPDIREIPLRGVLRSELQATLDTTLQQYLRDPQVFARSLVRLSVTGGVDNAGIHLVDAHAPIGDAIMAAGGLASNSELQEARIMRGGQRIVSPVQFNDALVEGRTLGELGIRTGDRLHIPVRERSGSLLQSSLFMVPSLLGVITFFF